MAGLRNVDLDALERQLAAVKDQIDDEWSSAYDDCTDNHETGCECYTTKSTERGQLLMDLKHTLDEALKELKKKGTAVMVAAPKGR